MWNWKLFLKKTKRRLVTVQYVAILGLLVSVFYPQPIHASNISAQILRYAQSWGLFFPYLTTAQIENISERNAAVLTHSVFSNLIENNTTNQEMISLSDYALFHYLSFHYSLEFPKLIDQKMQWSDYKHKSDESHIPQIPAISDKLLTHPHQIIMLHLSSSAQLNQKAQQLSRQWAQNIMQQHPSIHPYQFYFFSSIQPELNNIQWDIRLYQTSSHTLSIYRLNPMLSADSMYHFNDYQRQINVPAELKIKQIDAQTESLLPEAIIQVRYQLKTTTPSDIRLEHIQAVFFTEKRQRIDGMKLLSTGAMTPDPENKSTYFITQRYLVTPNLPSQKILINAQAKYRISSEDASEHPITLATQMLYPHAEQLFTPLAFNDPALDYLRQWYQNGWIHHPYTEHLKNGTLLSPLEVASMLEEFARPEIRPAQMNSTDIAHLNELLQRFGPQIKILQRWLLDKERDTVAYAKNTSTLTGALEPSQFSFQTTQTAASPLESALQEKPSSTTSTAISEDTPTLTPEEFKVRFQSFTLGTHKANEFDDQFRQHILFHTYNDSFNIGISGAMDSPAHHDPDVDYNDLSWKFQKRFLRFSQHSKNHHFRFDSQIGHSDTLHFGQGLSLGNLLLDGANVRLHWREGGQLLLFAGSDVNSTTVWGGTILHQLTPWLQLGMVSAFAQPEIAHPTWSQGALIALRPGIGRFYLEGSLNQDDGYGFLGSYNLWLSSHWISQVSYRKYHKLIFPHSDPLTYSGITEQTHFYEEGAGISLSSFGLGKNKNFGLRIWSEQFENELTDQKLLALGLNLTWDLTRLTWQPFMRYEIASDNSDDPYEVGLAHHYYMGSLRLSGRWMAKRTLLLPEYAQLEESLHWQWAKQWWAQTGGMLALSNNVSELTPWAGINWAPSQNKALRVSYYHLAPQHLPRIDLSFFVQF